MHGQRRAFAARLRGHVVELIRLAAPTVVTRAGILVMSAVDAAMLGRTSVDQVAFHGLGVTPFVVVIVIGIGLLYGTMVATSQAAGREEFLACGQVWRRSLPYAAMLGVAAAALCQFGERFFLMTAQPAKIAEGAGSVVAILGLSIPGALLYFTTAAFLEGLRRPMPAMFVMIAANGLNVLLNWVLIFGRLGFPAMGADGAALSTTLVRSAMAAAIIAYVWWLRDRDVYGVRRPLAPGWWRAGAGQRRLGYGAGTSYGIEESAFGTINFFAGLLGALALASYTMQFLAFALVFMVALGIASSTSVRVGIAHGRGDLGEQAFAGWTGLGVVAVLMACCAVVFWMWPGAIARAFTSDPALTAATTPLIALSALAMVSDGGQIVIVNALRGAGETWAPVAANIVAYVGVMIPASWTLAFLLGYGTSGLICGFILASLVSVTLQSTRFWLISRR